MNEIRRIASFSVDHDYIEPGVYISRVDGDITTYDLRTRKPNAGDYMDNLTMHSLEHMFATLVRNSEIGNSVIYFGPMGCQTGFYLLVRDKSKDEVYSVIESVLADIVSYGGDMPGQARKECGNYKNLSLEAAKREARSYLSKLAVAKHRFVYPKGED